MSIVRLGREKSSEEELGVTNSPVRETRCCCRDVATGAIETRT